MSKRHFPFRSHIHDIVSSRHAPNLFAASLFLILFYADIAFAYASTVFSFARQGLLYPDDSA